MIVDWHAHVYPPEMAKERRWGGASPLTIENLLEAHEKAGIERCVVSNTIHYLKDKIDRRVARVPAPLERIRRGDPAEVQRPHYRLHQHAALRRRSLLTKNSNAPSLRTA